MTDRSINVFRDPYVAIYRPNKKTYSIIEWVGQGRFWKRALLNPDAMPHVTVRTQDIQPAECEINTYRNNTNRAIHVKCTASGRYLRYAGHDVAIIQKKPDSPASFSNTIFMSEFTCTTLTVETPGTLPLWSIGAPVPVYTHVSSVTIKPVPLPKRIAWIIAEDASKQGETCSITLEPISPLTASVTTCYHVFESNALATWLATKPTCPMCKQRTVATLAFDQVPDTDTPDTADTPVTIDASLRRDAAIEYPEIIQLGVV